MRLQSRATEPRRAAFITVAALAVGAVLATPVAPAQSVPDETQTVPGASRSTPSTSPDAAPAPAASRTVSPFEPMGPMLPADAPVAESAAATDVVVATRLPLLREGSFVVRAPSTLRFDPASGTWLIRLRDDLETESDREIVLLPCEALEDMIGHVRGRTTVQWFELTALVLSYKNRNFLLPMLGTPLSGEPPRQPRATLLPPGAEFMTPAAKSTLPKPDTKFSLSAKSAADARPAPATGSASTAGIATTRAVGATADSGTEAAPAPRSVDPERFAAEIERSLEEHIPVVARSSDPGADAPPVGGERAPRRLTSDVAPVTLATTVRVQDRRGVVTRDPITGTWRFVFQGERADVGERGVELLPSTVLERIERFVRESNTPPALLVSGQLTKFDGRNFLLPTSFRTIAAGRWITP